MSNKQQSRSGYLDEIPETRRIDGSRRLTTSQQRIIDGVKITSGERPLDQSSYLN